MGGTKGARRFNCGPPPPPPPPPLSEAPERDEAETSPFVLSDGEDRRHLGLIDFPFDIKDGRKRLALVAHKASPSLCKITSQDLIHGACLEPRD